MHCKLDLEIASIFILKYSLVFISKMKFVSELKNKVFFLVRNMDYLNPVFSQLGNESCDYSASTQL